MFLLILYGVIIYLFINEKFYELCQINIIGHYDHNQDQTFNHHSDFLLAICISPNPKILLQVKAMPSQLWARMYVLCRKGRFSSKWDTWKLLGEESLLVEIPLWWLGHLLDVLWTQADLFFQMVFVYTAEKAANIVKLHISQLSSSRCCELLFWSAFKNWGETSNCPPFCGVPSPN